MPWFILHLSGENMHADQTTAAEERDKDPQQAPAKDLDKVSIGDSQHNHRVVNDPPCATLIERVVGFLDRYDESCYG
jgi:hypothetical protein